MAKIMADMKAESRYCAKIMATRARSKLTVKQVAAITEPGVYSDGAGLYLRVRTSGRSWIYIGSFQSQRFELGLGSALDISLAKARERTDKIREALLDGKDPRVERARAKARSVGAQTFGAFAMDWLDGIEGDFKNPKHRQQWRNTLTTYAQPLFNLPIAEVSTQDIAAVLRPIWRTKAETASRLRGRIERVLDAAKALDLREGDNPAQWRGHLDQVLGKRKKKTEVKHHAALPFAEVRAFMAELRKRPGVAARALEFTVLTAARSGETRGMTWGEVDLEAKVWTVPKERMKAGKEHRVPLSDPALAVLCLLKEEGIGPADYVFPAPRGGSLSDMSMGKVLKRMGRDGVTVHGFRSSFRDWAGDETDFQREVIEMALAHGLPSAVEAAYRRGNAFDKRRELMAAWAEYCSPPQTFKQLFGRKR